MIFAVSQILDHSNKKGEATKNSYPDVPDGPWMGLLTLIAVKKQISIVYAVQPIVFFA